MRKHHCIIYDKVINLQNVLASESFLRDLQSYFKMKFTVHLCLPVVPMLMLPSNLFPVALALPLAMKIVPLLVIKLIDIDVGNREYTV